jgi:uncharacterized pyridoxal phosphate-dependent enzyme
MGVYENLGVKTSINAWGTITRIGGSRMDPRVLEAMTEASRSFVDMHALHHNAGRAIARMLSVEAACVTSGAVAGLAIAAAACMTRDDSAKILQLPDTRSMRNEALVLKAHRILYDQGVRLSGAQFVEVGVTSFASVEQIEAAITDRTAMFFYVAEASSMRGSLPLADVAATLAKHNIPLVVDAAAELPPVSNLTAFFADGADLVVFSGGKEIRGPQSSGLILGSEEMIGYCIANCFPNYSVGRAMKTDKETIVGLVKAVELFMQRDYDKIYQEWEDAVANIVSALSDLPQIKVRRGFPTQPGVQPADVPRVYIEPLASSAADLQEHLRDSDPSVAVGVEGLEVVLNPQCLDADEIAPLISAVAAAVS